VTARCHSARGPLSRPVASSALQNAPNAHGAASRPSDRTPISHFEDRSSRHHSISFLVRIEDHLSTRHTNRRTRRSEADPRAASRVCSVKSRDGLSGPGWRPSDSTLRVAGVALSTLSALVNHQHGCHARRERESAARQVPANAGARQSGKSVGCRRQSVRMFILQAVLALVDRDRNVRRTRKAHHRSITTNGTNSTFGSITPSRRYADHTR
jgi:hypothetical protein